jgi:hypothetical protein
MMAVLILGGMAFDDFEIPGRMLFGGAQHLAVHRLIGGVRVIDAMGRDDAAVRWSGVFSGSEAGTRARMLDTMRALGGQLNLAWDAFCYSVVIDRLDLDFRNPWWIPYHISCAVVMDLAQNIAAPLVVLADSIADDLTSASAFVDVSAAIAATSVSDSLTRGNGDYAAATIALSNAQGAISQGINTAQGGLVSTDLASVVSASGTLAQLCTASGYVGRAVANLQNVGT